MSDVFGRRQIIVISDFQEGSNLSALQGQEWPKGIQLVSERVAVRTANAGLHLLADANQTPISAGGTRVRVSNEAGSKREQFQVGWARSDGYFVGKPAEVYVPAGQSRILTLTSPDKDSGADRITLRGDDEAFDNTVFSTPPEMSRLSVIYIGEPETDSRGPLYFVRRALQGAPRRAIQITTKQPAAALLPSETEKAMMFIVTTAVPEELAATLRSQLAQGKTVLFAPANAAAATTLGSLLGQSSLAAEEVVPRNYAMLGEVDFRHPLFAPFADARYSDFTKIHFWKYRRLDLRSLPGAHVVASFDNGDAAIVDVAVGKGRVFFFASGWQPADSQLALSSKFVPLLYSMLELSGGSSAKAAHFLVGDPVPLPADWLQRDGSTAVTLPDGSSVRLAVGQTNFTRALMPGIYHLKSGKTERRFAVNLDAVESRTSPLPLDELERLGVPVAAAPMETARVAQQKAVLQSAELENRQKLWRWFVAATLGVLLVETAVAGWMARRRDSASRRCIVTDSRRELRHAGDREHGTPIETLLGAKLGPAIRQRHRARLAARLAGWWAILAILSLVLLSAQREGRWSSLWLLSLVAIGVAGALLITRRQRLQPMDLHEIARRIESRHPDLDGLLLTAVQQKPDEDGRLNYLQERVVMRAIQHGYTRPWTEPVNWRIAGAHLANGLALLLLVWVLAGIRSGGTGKGILNGRWTAGGITITPGDTSLERGERLVVMASFKGPIPAEVTLITRSPSAPPKRIPLVRSLSDPLFGGSIPAVSTDLVYCVEYGGKRTRDFTVKVFEFPRLERADADLTFPDYTGLAPKRIENTRRISAVEGTLCNLTLQLNKTVLRAQLILKGESNHPIPLALKSNSHVATLAGLAFTTNRSYLLQLVDAEGRTNKSPEQFVVNVLKNREPELKIVSPRGDTRPSALEEIAFEGTVWDDFGVKAYGLAFTEGGGETKFIELGHTVPGNEKRTFKHLLRLEELGMQPGQLITWFLWADDIGSDGQLRRSTSDMYFAEVRPFDELFRQGQAGGEQPGSGGESGGGGPRARLAELQKQIINATWNLQRQQSRQSRAPEQTKPQRRRRCTQRHVGD